MSVAAPAPTGWPVHAKPARLGSSNKGEPGQVPKIVFTIRCSGLIGVVHQVTTTSNLTLAASVDQIYLIFKLRADHSSHRVTDRRKVDL